MFIAIVCFRPTGTVDVWWTLEVGDYILAEGDVPRTALWTIEAVRDLPYVCHGWLPALMFSSAANTLGVDAVPGVPTLPPDVTSRGLEFINRHVKGNVLNSYSLGGLLIYFTYPQIRVSMDSRADPYPPAYYAAYQNALYGTTARATRAFVNRHAIDHIIVARRTYERIVRPKLSELSDFRLVYQDELTVVLSRMAGTASGGMRLRLSRPTRSGSSALP
jgi:hypothetical protein